ncbi:MAG: leucyl aminopeptidase [Planctomycetota bacterium]
MRITHKPATRLPRRLSLLMAPVYQTSATAELDAGAAKWVPADARAALASGDLSGAAGTRLLLHTPSKRGAQRVLLIGLGEKKSLTADRVRRYAGIAAAAAARTAGQTAALLIPTARTRALPHAELRALVEEGAALGAYKFLTYKSQSGDASARPLIRELLLCESSESSTPSERRDGSVRANALAYGINLCRELGNLPPNDLGPEQLAARARVEARKAGLKSRVLDERQLARAGMRALLAVGQGSRRPPRLIILEHAPRRGDGRPPLVLVGKAVTFDSGGISIKSAQGMEDMKYDMCGGGAVIGAMAAIGRIAPRRRVIGLVPTAENMPDGGAYRPGDILRSANGLTIEIINTDAEGRLALADALHYAQQYEPSLLVDVATLTGSIAVALGPSRAGVFSRDERLARRVAELGTRLGEKMWTMPIDDEHLDAVKSDHADLKNSGGRFGGACTAAAFLSRFAGDVPWVHLDIASCAWIERDHDLGPRGASGFAVRTLVQLAEESLPL